MDSFLLFVVKCSISVPMTTIAIPLFTLIYSLALIYRTLVVRGVGVVGYRKWGDSPPGLMEPLDVGSAFVAQIEPPFKLVPSSVILTIAVLEGVPDINKIRDLVRDKLLLRKGGEEEGGPLYPEMLQTVENFMGYPFWKRIPGLTVEMARDKYVTFNKRMGGGGWDHKSLLEFGKTFALKQFKEGGPLWEIAVLESYTPSTGGGSQPYFAAIGRVHHTLTDGAGFLSVLQSLQDNPNKTSPQSRRNLLPPSYYVYKTLSPMFRGVYDLVSLFINSTVFTSPNTVWPTKTAPILQDTCPKETIEFSAAHSLSLGNRCATLTTVKELSKAWGVSGTTVILTAILRGVRKTMFDGQKIPPTSVAMGMPLASPEHSGKLTNQAFYINLILPLYVENPETHSREVDKEFQSVKTTSLPYVLEMFCKLGGMIPNFIMESLLRKGLGTRPELICFSTVVGPKESSSMFGHGVKEMFYLFQLADGHKFPFFQLFSTTDKLYMALSGDKGLIEDDAMARKMVMAFHDEIASFEKFLSLGTSTMY